MSHPHLLRFTFTYDGDPPKIPLIPLRFIDTHQEPTPLFNAILDSGADEITIPRELAEFLGYDLKRREEAINTAGGEITAFSTRGNLYIGRGGREVFYEHIELCVIDEEIPILVGIRPLFNDYSVNIKAFKNKVTLTPRNLRK